MAKRSFHDVCPECAGVNGAHRLWCSTINLKPGWVERALAEEPAEGECGLPGMCDEHGNFYCKEGRQKGGRAEV